MTCTKNFNCYTEVVSVVLFNPIIGSDKSLNHFVYVYNIINSVEILEANQINLLKPTTLNVIICDMDFGFFYTNQLNP